MNKSHIIEIFSADCPLCRDVINIVELGKCSSCKMEIYNLNKLDKEIKEKILKYRIKAVPTIVIDGEIKVEGAPDFPWFCGEEFYKMLKEKFPLK
ncbi:MAG: thioredoxin family protein [candidate division WOR-3 bacterium]